MFLLSIEQPSRAPIVLEGGQVLQSLPVASAGVGGYLTIEQAGVPLPQRSVLNFVSGATIVDNPGAGSTDVTILGAPTPTGTGFFHVTGGVADAASRAVNLATADVTGTLAIFNGGTGLSLLGAANSLLRSTGAALSYTTKGDTSFLGTSVATTSPDGTSSSELTDATNTTALAADPAVTLYTTAAIASGQAMTVDCEFGIKVDGSTLPADRAVIRRTFCVVNNAGALTTPSGGTADTDLTPTTFVGANMVTAVCQLSISGTSIIATAQRPAGVACHALIRRIDIRVGSP